MILRDIWQFAKAVWKHYIILLTSSAVVAAVMFWEHYRGISIGTRIFFGIAALLLIVAFFRTWRDEYTTRLSEQSKRISTELELSKTRTELDTERSKLGLEEVQAKLAEANLEVLTAGKNKREAQEKHDERIRFLSAPDTGIRSYAAQQRQIRGVPAVVVTVEQLVTEMCAKQDEIEEALRVLRSQGYVKETSLPGRWYIP